MANYMAEVAKMLGVELGEEFEVDLGSSILNMTATLTDNGFKVNQTNMIAPSQHSSSCIFEWLLCGLATIKRKPWKPSPEEPFWYINSFGEATLYRYFSCAFGERDNFYKIGNCYRTCAEAKANCDKWIAFYASDEVLEV